MSNVINLNRQISIAQAARAVMAYGRFITPQLIGEPGIGKSSVLKLLRELYGDKYDYIYVDCPVMDMSDIVLRIPNHATKTLESYVSSLFKLDSPKPKIIMLDEANKAPKLLQIIFQRLKLERMVGDVPLTDGSIVFDTSNHTSDGVGDTMLAHGTNRVIKFYVRKNNANEMLVYATEHNVSPVLRAWLAMNPRAMASYLDGGQDDNPLIFHPSRKESFVSPRSYMACDPIVRMRDEMGAEITEAALAGTVGAAAAQSMAAFMAMEKELVSIKTVKDDPEGTPIPENPAALFMMMFNAIDSIEVQDDLSKIMRYVNRIKSSEVQSVFFTMLLQSKKTVRLAKNNQQVMEWAKNNYELVM